MKLTRNVDLEKYGYRGSKILTNGAQDKTVFLFGLLNGLPVHTDNRKKIYISWEFFLLSLSTEIIYTTMQAKILSMLMAKKPIQSKGLSTKVIPIVLVNYFGILYSQ